MATEAGTATLAFRGKRTSAGSLWRVLTLGERIASAAILIPVVPVVALCGITVRVLSRRTPFVAHLRIGQYGNPLWVLKLRTMWNGRPERGARFNLVEHISDDAGPLKKSEEDARVSSRFARLCRIYSLDELPQLLHVLSGEMSFVGPRPLTMRELRDYYKSDTAEVLSVKPGITGLWQVMGRSMLTYTQRRRLDLFLVRRRCLSLYFYVLFRTIPVVLSGRGSV